jgi:putative protein-disulfide isomerase
MENRIQPTLYYCYDPYCGWCYGFSPVMMRIARQYAQTFALEVLSGGMILPEEPTHFAPMARYIQTAYQNVEEMTGIRFGKEFLWHVFHPDETDWFPDSTKPAIALCIFKEYFPDNALAFATDLQFALNDEGRDLTDDEAYRHLVVKYDLPEQEFYAKLRSEEYKEKAYYEFALVKQLQVTGFPCLLLQITDSKFYLLAQGYTDYETIERRIGIVLAEAGRQN